MKPVVQRRILGISAVVSFIAAATIYVFGWDFQPELAFFCRAGAILAAAWFAFDSVQRIPTWLLIALIATVIVVVCRPRLFFLLAPAILIAAILRKILLGRPK